MSVSSFQFRISSVLVCLLAASWILAAPPSSHAKDFTTLRVLVTNEDGKPLQRASVILTKMKIKKDKPKLTGESLQLKTSMEGSAPFPPLEQGTYMIQVISQGYQTHGGRIELNQTEQTHSVAMKPPQDQFSVHEK